PLQLFIQSRFETVSRLHELGAQVVLAAEAPGDRLEFQDFGRWLGRYGGRILLHRKPGNAGGAANEKKHSGSLCEQPVPASPTAGRCLALLLDARGYARPQVAPRRDALRQLSRSQHQRVALVIDLVVNV